jgi:hypothetical protein
VDALGLWGVKRYRDDAERLRWLKYACVALPAAFTAVFILVGAPVSLVFIGAVGQGLMLPFLAGAALYYVLPWHQPAPRSAGRQRLADLPHRRLHPDDHLDRAGSEIFRLLGA